MKSVEVKSKLNQVSGVEGMWARLVPKNIKVAKK